jgi:type II secretory pathway predicted ATPase ExeA
METERRQARTRKRERRAARREQLRAWRHRNAHPLEARWYLSDEEPLRLGEVVIDRLDARSPAPLFITAAMKRLLAKALFLIAANPGFVVITGPAGIGKSAFAAWLGRELAAAGHLVVLIDCADTMSDDLVERLLQRFETEQRTVPVTQAAPVVIMDGAELLAERVLRSLSPLVTMDMGHGQPIRVVLIGRTRLARRLEERRTRDLRPVISFCAQLKPLNKSETRRFIRELAASNHEAARISDDALDAIVRESQGRPAHVRFLWTRAHALARVEGEQTPRPAHVHIAAHMLRPRCDAATAVHETLAPRGGTRHRGAARARISTASARWRVARYAATAAAFALLWFASAGRNPDAPWPEATSSIEQVVEAPATSLPTSDGAGGNATAAIATSDTASAPDTTASARAERATPLPEEEKLALADAPATQSPAKAAAIPETTSPQIAAVAEAPSVPAPAPSAVVAKRVTASAKEAAKPAKTTRFARLDTPPHRDQLALNAVVPLDQGQQPRPAPAETVMQVAMAVPVTAQPRCEPYVATINYAGSNANVRGTACHDASGQWWLMDQQVE